MAEANLNRDDLLINDGLASIVIVNSLADIPGGRTLNTTLLADDVKVIKAGHIIVQDKDTKEPYALGVDNGAYTNLDENKSYLGVLKASVLKADPRASILTQGQVNAAASPYPVTDEIKKGLPRIEFLF